MEGNCRNSKSVKKKDKYFMKLSCKWYGFRLRADNRLRGRGINWGACAFTVGAVRMSTYAYPDSRSTN